MPKLKPLSLADFTATRRLWPGIRHWDQVLDWNREGLLSVIPIDAHQADVSLTPKGRAALEVPVSEDG